jgi:hypothetical protein
VENAAVGSGLGDKMVFTLIDHADIVQKAAMASQDALTERINKLADIQRRIEATLFQVKEEADSLRASAASVKQVAAHAIQAAIQQQAGEIKRQTEQALVPPLEKISKAADQATQKIDSFRWLYLVSILLIGTVAGLVLGYAMVGKDQGKINDRLDQMEQTLAARQNAPVEAPSRFHRMVRPAQRSAAGPQQ